MTGVDCEALRVLMAKATRVDDWSWDDMRVDADGEVYVPECSYLGPTAIALASDYENSGNDCAYIAAALNAIPALLAKSAAYDALVARVEAAPVVDIEDDGKNGGESALCGTAMRLGYYSGVRLRLLVSDDRPSHTAGEK